MGSAPVVNGKKGPRAAGQGLFLPLITRQGQGLLTNPPCAHGLCFGSSDGRPTIYLEAHLLPIAPLYHLRSLPWLPGSSLSKEEKKKGGGREEGSILPFFHSSLTRPWHGVRTHNWITTCHSGLANLLRDVFKVRVDCNVGKEGWKEVDLTPFSNKHYRISLFLPAGSGCVDKPLATLWRNHVGSDKPNIVMKLTICASGLKAVTKEHGLTEYWANRITYCAADPNYPKVFCWIYR